MASVPHTLASHPVLGVFAVGFNHSCVGPQIVMSSKSHRLCMCPWSSTCSLDSPISVSCFYFGFPIATVFSPCSGLPFCSGLPRASLPPAGFHSTFSLSSVVSGLSSSVLVWPIFLWGSPPLQGFLLILQAPVLWCCFSVWPLLLMGFSVCAPGAVSVAGKDAVLCLSVRLYVLPCWVLRGWWGCAVLAVPRALGTI